MKNQRESSWRSWEIVLTISCNFSPKDFSGLNRAPDLAGSFRSKGLPFYSHGLLFAMPELAIMEVIKFKDTAVNSSLQKAASIINT